MIKFYFLLRTQLISLNLHLVFDLQGNDCIFNENVFHDETDTEYYNHYLKIITYDKPII